MPAVKNTGEAITNKVEGVVEPVVATESQLPPAVVAATAAKATGVVLVRFTVSPAGAPPGIELSESAVLFTDKVT